MLIENLVEDAKKIVTEDDALGFVSNTLAGISFVSEQHPRKKGLLKRAALVVSEFRHELQFAPMSETVTSEPDASDDSSDDL